MVERARDNESSIADITCGGGGAWEGCGMCQHCEERKERVTFKRRNE